MAAIGGFYIALASIGGRGVGGEGGGGRLKEKGGVSGAAQLDKGFYRCWGVRSGQYKINMCDGRLRSSSWGYQHPPAANSAQWRPLTGMWNVELACVGE